MTGARECQPEADGLRNTPTPWRRSANSFGTQFVYGNPNEPRTSPMGVKYNDLIAGGDMPNTLTEANATFIVEAVNSHATLQARVEELTKALEEIVHPVRFMEDRAKATGDRINGEIAMSLARDPEYLRAIAQRAVAVPLEDRK